jgi:hypothetical protein
MIQPHHRFSFYKCSGGIHFRVTILAESVRHFNGYEMVKAHMGCILVSRMKV